MAQAPPRVTAIDAVRGLVMIVMALDHVRDFVHAGAMSFSPEDLTRTTPALFLTRWITHICAPAFVFLAGVGAQRWLSRHGSVGALRSYLVSRGLWLVLLELAVIRFFLNFRLLGPDALLLLVLCALGLSMVALAFVVSWPTRVLVAVGLAIVTLHNLLDGVQAQNLGAFAPFWLLLHQQGVIPIGSLPAVVAYPVLPWFGVILLGFAAGTLYDRPAEERQHTLWQIGLATTVLFVIWRALVPYGDPQPWAAQDSPVLTVLSFLRTTKYPPSFVFLLMTLGPVLMLLAWFERVTPRFAGVLVVFGRVPLFYYLVHFGLAHVIASCLVWARYGSFSLAFLSGPFPSTGGAQTTFPDDLGWSLGVTCVVWLVVVLVMYPLCRWFGALKARHQGARWVSYV